MAKYFIVVISNKQLFINILLFFKLNVVLNNTENNYFFILHTNLTYDLKIKIPNKKKKFVNLTSKLEHRKIVICVLYATLSM